MIPAALRSSPKYTPTSSTIGPSAEERVAATERAAASDYGPTKGGASFFRHRIESAMRSTVQTQHEDVVDDEIDTAAHGGSAARESSENATRRAIRLTPNMFGSNIDGEVGEMSDMMALDAIQPNDDLQIGTELGGDGWLRESTCDAPAPFAFDFAPESKAAAMTGMKSKIAHSMRVTQSHAVRDRLVEVIDNSRLVSVGKIPGYIQRAQDVQKAAETLVSRIGIHNVVLLQLTAHSRIDHSGVLRGFVIVVKKEAPIAPILETMPDYGAGRTVFNGIQDPKGVDLEADFSSGDARRVITELIQSKQIVDLSDPANETERLQAQSFLRTMAELGGDQLKVVPPSMAPGRVLADTVDLNKAESVAVRSAMTNTVSLAQHGCSVALCKYAEDISVVCSSYSQTVADLIAHRMRDGDAFRTVEEFISSPLPQMALDHGYVARASVIAQVAKEVERTPNPAAFKKQQVSFAAQANIVESDPWFIQEDVPKKVAADQVHCCMRKVSNTSSEWRAIREQCLVRMETDDEFEGNRERNLMLSTPTPSEYVIAFNDVVDVQYANNHKDRTTFQRPALSVDFGASRAFGVISSSENAFSLSTDGIFGLPYAGVQPCSHAALVKLIPPARQRRLTAAVGYGAENDPTDSLALLVSSQHAEREIRSIFQGEGREAEAAVSGAIRLRNLLHAHFAETVDLNTLDALERHGVLFRWCSSVDPSLLTLSKRRSMITSNSSLVIDTRHKAQLREVFTLLINSLDRVGRNDPLLKQLQNMIQPGTSSVNPDGVVLNLSSELVDRLLAGWDAPDALRI